MATTASAASATASNASTSSTSSTPRLPHNHVYAMATTPALMKFEIETLTEYNKELAAQGQDDHFKTYDQLKEIHDNTGTTRKYLTGIVEHVMMEYLDDLNDDDMLQIANELNISNTNYTHIKCALFDKYVESPSPKQLKMMSM